MQAEPDVPVDRSVLDMCAELAPEPGLALDPNTVLADVGFDSLGCADLAVAIEERFGVRLPDAEVAEFKTVKEVASAVKAGVKARRERIPKDLGRSQLAAKRVVRPILAAYSRLRVEGEDNVPATGPVLIAPNHRSMFDIPIAVIAAPRRVFFMAKQELFGDPIRDRLWLELGGFPVKRQIADVRLERGVPAGDHFSPQLDDVVQRAHFRQLHGTGASTDAVRAAVRPVQPLPIAQGSAE